MPPVLEFLGEWGIRKVLVRGRRDFSVFGFVIPRYFPVGLGRPVRIDIGERLFTEHRNQPRRRLTQPRWRLGGNGPHPPLFS